MRADTSFLLNELPLGQKGAKPTAYRLSLQRVEYKTCIKRADKIQQTNKSKNYVHSAFAYTTFKIKDVLTVKVVKAFTTDQTNNL